MDNLVVDNCLFKLPELSMGRFVCCLLDELNVSELSAGSLDSKLSLLGSLNAAA